MGCSAGLLVSGLINAVLAIQRYEFNGGVYHMLVGVKLLAALALFGLSALLAGSSELAVRVRQRLIWWLNVSLLLAALLVGVAGVMKFTSRVPKPNATGGLSAQPDSPAVGVHENEPTHG